MSTPEKEEQAVPSSRRKMERTIIGKEIISLAMVRQVDPIRQQHDGECSQT